MLRRVLQLDKKESVQLKFDSAKPTKFNLKLLRECVIWQFPQKLDGGFVGAVHPPMPKYGWLPATIYPEKQVAQIHGHLLETFATPELAAGYLTVDSGPAK